MSFDVQAYLRSLSRFGIKPGLDRIRAILARLGDPQRRFPAVHIGGTNGKGSTAAITAAVLSRAGYRVGLYTSPHLVRYNERIRVDGAAISDEELSAIFAEVAQAAAAVRERLGSDPTEFEVGTAAAFLYFARREVDVAVVEVGLGGRLDSTNVVHSAAVAITPVSLDHTAVLGADLPTIAAEKAGIFRPGVPAVIAPQAPEAEAVFAAAAQRVGCPLVWVREVDEAALENSKPAASSRGAYFRILSWGMDGGRLDVWTPERSYRDVRVGLLGRHQVQNAAVAVSLLTVLAQRGFPIPEEALRDGVAGARWPGRLELVPGRPNLLLDGMHNPAGAAALATSLERLLAGRRILFVVGLMADRNPRDVLRPLLPHAAHVVATRPSSARTAPIAPEEIAQVANELGVSSESAPTAKEALAAACRAAPPDGLVCVCGSLYLVGEVKGLLEAGWQPSQEERSAYAP